jgi:hypothetical protein
MSLDRPLEIDLASARAKIEVDVERVQAAASDGKEGVIGSSPIEGFAKSLLIRSFC